MSDFKENKNDYRLIQYIRANTNATNDMDSVETYRKRLYYSAYAYEYVDEDIRRIIKDFNFNETILYGRVDPRYRPVYVNENRLKLIPGTENQYALDFVATAASEFMQQVQIDKGTKLKNSPLLETLQIKRSYVPQRAGHILLLQICADSFLNVYNGLNRMNEIMTMKDFILKFESFVMEYAQKNTISSYAYITSTSCNINSTGLCIDFTDAGFSEDQLKMFIIEQGESFDYYLRLAARFGFYVDKMQPLRLIANLSSKTTRKFMTAEGATGVDINSIFQNNYQVAHNDDLNILSNWAFDTYSRLFSQSPSEKINFIDNGNLFSTYKKREYPDQETFTQMFSEDYWISFYVKLRNVESQLHLVDADINEIISVARKMNKQFDTSVAMDYIHNQLLDIPVKEGSSYDKSTRSVLRNRGSLPDKAEIDYPEYLREVYKKR